MIELTETDQGIILPVRAQPGAKRNQILGTHNGQLKVAVTATPEKGKANQALLKVLVRELGLKKSQVELINGRTSPQKQFLIRGITLTELQQKLQSRKL